MEIKPIAHIKTDFPEKFGIPRQSCQIEELTGRILFEPEYRNPHALRGMEEFTHLWLIWEFSASVLTEWQPTVRPPKLGGNIRKGVFATRSPFRPNPIGLSCVKLDRIEQDPEYGPVIVVKGPDLMDGTPIYDIKPYIPYADSHPEAAGSFATAHKDDKLKVAFPEELQKKVPEEKRQALFRVLECDPRPAYQNDPLRVYGFAFAGLEIRFRVEQDCLTVCEILPESGKR